jgi:hypothetical protein
VAPLIWWQQFRNNFALKRRRKSETCSKAPKASLNFFLWLNTGLWKSTQDPAAKNSGL